MEVPAYLHDYAELYAQNPRNAAMTWFKNAKYGLFMHYGVYSLLGRGEWVMFHEQIPVAEYSKLQERFTASDFDADAITDLALAAQMQYITITTRHHDSFCLFKTAQTDFNSVDTPGCGRDLIGELAEACAKKGIGLFFYYSYGADWRHPYFFPVEAGSWIARPHYEKPDPSYKWQKDADFQHYIDFTHAQLRELLTQYGPIAGMWFDPIMPYYHRHDLYPVAETYALIRELQPQALIVFKQGANGDEDFAAPERVPGSKAKDLETPEQKAVADHAWESNKRKKIEICDTLQPGKWGYNADDSGNHHTRDEVLDMLSHAAGLDANLLLNTGPLPDGGIDPEDEAVLREVGTFIRENGWPKAK